MRDKHKQKWMMIAIGSAIDYIMMMMRRRMARGGRREREQRAQRAAEVRHSRFWRIEILFRIHSAPSLTELPRVGTVMEEVR